MHAYAASRAQESATETSNLKSRLSRREISRGGGPKKQTVKVLQRRRKYWYDKSEVDLSSSTILGEGKNPAVRDDRRTR